jgi:SAM-dependent MidA family methyltransferase
MEQALYHPEHGYYSSGRAVIGRGGDYFTNVSVGPLFGRLLAAQFAEMWALLGEPPGFSIVEQGAHDGQFACDVLDAAKERTPAFFEALHYQIVEPLPKLVARQRETLAGFAEKVVWSTSLAELEPFTGVHFSNELLDALPMHLLRWSGKEWHERHVSVTDAGLDFVDLPVANPELRQHLECISVGALREGYETEVNLAALRWIDDVAQKLTRGFVLLADYGFPREEFYAAHRTAGTLQCYARHRVVPSPLTQIGHADMTSHVEWTSVAARAEAAGLTLRGFADQHHFITGLLAGDFGAELTATADAKTKRALQTLLHPTFLGMTFQFLALSKQITAPTRLAGFRFGRDPRLLLGLASARGSS